MPTFFIDRPNFAWVIAIFITLAGLLAIRFLPVSQFPVVAPPQIMITATYPGASATMVVDSVTSIIEEELNGAKGLLYFDSTASSAGTAEITVTFEPGTNPDLAQVDVQNRLQNAQSRLPASVVQQGIHVEQANSGFLLMYTLGYKDGAGQGRVNLDDYAVRSVNNEISRIPGVGRVQFFGAEAAMRIWIDPQKLVGYGLSVTDVNNAIAAQNVQVPAGSFGSKPGTTDQELTASIVIKGILETPEAFGRIILRSNENGSTVTLGDVARIEIGKQDYNFSTVINGKAAVGAAVQLAPGANALQTAKAVKERLAELSTGFPDGVEFAVPYDTSTFVGVAIEKVIHTLGEAIVLVFVVMFLFLQNIRYTLIPTIVVPVCLAGTLTLMYALGFSVNMMTMFGMVLAIGILVDDAIVVVENVERIMAEEGLSPRLATIKAMQQVSGAIMGITVALASVFLPLAFMSGSVGVIYQQFSLTLVVSILFSGFLALTLTPALCATILKTIPQGHNEEKTGFFGWFNRKFAVLTDRFSGINAHLVHRSGRFMLIYVAIVAALGFSYIRLPEAFVPVEDQGFYLVNLQLPAGATYARTEKTTDELNQYLLGRDTTATTAVLLGYSFFGNGQNAAMGFVTLNDWSTRATSASNDVAAFNARFSQLSDGQAMAIEPPPIEGLGNAGGFSLRLQDRGGMGHAALLAARDKLLAAASQSSVIAYAMMEGLEDAPALNLQIDRAKAEALGISFSSINSAISSAFGSASVADFSNAGRQQRVVVQADMQYRMTPDTLLNLSVPNRNGEQVPLGSFVSMKWENGPVQLARYNGYPAIRISGDAAPGHSSGEAMAEMERIISTLPEGVGYEWTGLSLQEKLAGAQAPLLIALSFTVVFLLLVALYESWAIPVAVMLIVPIGALGAVLAVTVLGMPNDVYFKVGLITIIGLSAKNAILIVEFAKSLHEKGASIRDAAMEAVRLRFRPIIMTSMAFILGVVPLALATGAGAASQHAIGVGVIGGMVFATLLGVVFVPVFFVWVLGHFARNARKEKNQTVVFQPDHEDNL
ncbi:multidrug efflux RND transporter permease subunit [Dickeya chrysanthemi]|uniref:multidrug efflux RND transporter permease subunit n=1 Tax=Dickeya chrysanthemi TaxID=556 RepID=UPI0025A2118D|nr:multidrug efflux RND transporter permease subunit [Dickeya chrysanthemi]WJM84165.1 multidrug efflux RND transporter permease subunit [Dickeya chrysanthemi]